MNYTLIGFKSIVTQFMVVLVFIENVFFFSFENLIASLVLLFGWLIIKTFCLTAHNMSTYPVSFLMMLGLAIFHYVLPIPLTLIEMKPVTFNMNVPYLTFFHHFIFIMMLVIIHKLYTIISKGSNIFRVLLSNTKFYKSPSDRQIWISALIGLVLSFYLYFIYGQWQRDASERTIMFYVATVFAPFIWMPLIISFSKFRSVIPQKNRLSVKYIIVYSIMVFLISIVSNMRTILFSGVILFTFLYMIGVLYQFYSIEKLISPQRIIIVFCLFLFITGPLIDLGYTMVLVRSDRMKMPATEFLKRTFQVYQDKESLNQIKSIRVAYKEEQPYLVKRWNEEYIDNLLLNRFCNLKISDNCLYHAKNIGFQNHEMQAELLNQIVAFTPNILLNLFDIDYEKKLLSSSYSITDYLYSLSINDPNVRGSAVIGSMPGLGMSIFGYWYLLVIVPIFLVIFAMFDSFVLIRNGRIVFSYYFFVMLLMTVNYFNDRHVFTFEIRFVLRTYFESIITFLLAMKVIRFIDRLLPHKTPRLIQSR